MDWFIKWWSVISHLLSETFERVCRQNNCSYEYTTLRSKILRIKYREPGGDIVDTYGGQRKTKYYVQGDIMDMGKHVCMNTGETVRIVGIQVCVLHISWCLVWRKTNRMHIHSPTPSHPPPRLLQSHTHYSLLTSTHAHHSHTQSQKTNHSPPPLTHSPTPSHPLPHPPESPSLTVQSAPVTLLGDFPWLPRW